MCSRFLRVVFAVALCAASAAQAAPLRICADPDNVPFSNRAGQGFDNRIAAMIAHYLGSQSQFVWARSRRGFLREQFNKGACDVLTGLPQGMRGVATSIPYYRSTYVFVTPSRAQMQITRFDDPHLNSGRIGLQVLEEDYGPPSLPLIRNGHAAQLVGFQAFGEQGKQIVKAVADGRVNYAVVWGPLAGYFTRRDHLAVELSAVSPVVDSSGVPFAYSISFGVRKRDHVLLEQIDRAIEHLQPQIDSLLGRYNVPRASDEKEVR